MNGADEPNEKSLSDVRVNVTWLCLLLVAPPDPVASFLGLFLLCHLHSIALSVSSVVHLMYPGCGIRSRFSFHVKWHKWGKSPCQGRDWGHTKGKQRSPLLCFCLYQDITSAGVLVWTSLFNGKLGLRMYLTLTVVDWADCLLSYLVFSEPDTFSPLRKMGVFTPLNFCGVVIIYEPHSFSATAHRCCNLVLWKKKKKTHLLDDTQAHWPLERRKLETSESHGTCLEMTVSFDTLVTGQHLSSGCHMAASEAWTEQRCTLMLAGDVFGSPQPTLHFVSFPFTFLFLFYINLLIKAEFVFCRFGSHTSSFQYPRTD